MKWVIYSVLAVVLLVGGFYALNSYIYYEKQGEPVTDYKNITFTISGEPITLVNGIYEAPPVPNWSVASTTVEYFGNEARGDIDNDGDDDVVFLVTQYGAGTGVFLFLVGALNDGAGYRGTAAMYIGDRIAPQPTSIKDGLVLVNFADRKPGEPFTAAPSVGKTIRAKYSPDTNDFGEVVQNFDGESDLIRVTSPAPGATIESPVTITGEARGTWYFEASFPIYVVDWDGKIIGEGYAEAQSDWMTSEFVPFIARVSFDTAEIHNNYSKRGTLILKKDNPSGLSAHDAAIEIPVMFK